MKLGIIASVIVLVFVGGLAAYTGLGKSDAQRASDTAHAFVRGLMQNDKEAALATLTAEAREKMRDQDWTPTSKSGANADYQMGTPEIDGERALVPVTVINNVGEGETAETKKLTIKMRREAGEWRVWAMRFPSAPDGPQVTMDFEHPEGMAGEMLRAAGEGLGAALKGLGEGLGAFIKGVSDGANGANAAPLKK